MTDPSALIAVHIARHGVTRCPAAIVAPTSVELSPADIEAHQRRQLVEMHSANFGWQPPPERRRGNRR